MSEQDYSQSEMEKALSSVHEVKIGDVVKGEVLAIDDGQLVVGIQGTGVEGVVPLKELTSDRNANINDQAQVGDVLDLVVIASIGHDKENGSYLLSKRRLEARKVWTTIEDKFKADETLSVTVKEVVKGGLVADADGVRGFIPASMVADRYVDDLKKYVGETFEVKIIEIEPSENRLILSRKALVQQEKAEERKVLFEKLLPGDVVEGKVARLTNFGAFIDLGGADGLVHISEIAYERVDKPSDVLKVGEDVKVKVLSVDAEKGRISLSIKALLPGPWDKIAEVAPVGAAIDGKVKRLTTFGAFVEVAPGVEGLVHISQISHQHIATPNEVLKEGQDVKVKVLSVDPENRRLSLSIKALIEQPASEKKQESAAVPEEHYEIPEADTGFSFGEMIGDALKKNLDKDSDQ
ncbi:rpsA protein [Lapidilactobacillus concavus DSM 17758]|uniref:RpsA protein n=1 Tax=Lapidilactobacillus concavus DSM 17758 TaxID=1423735 RepID=A0A0R1VSI3_9LACO|nr:30S ribosomal protein S1 [Lapidilactobacillus concavus]KRM08721.1 rpsA protein [Lapidilactobacillus concavus DSM 17758]GEL13884.1 30S ribosomal protein S1 [Lapidilactobacillus concavus]